MIQYMEDNLAVSVSALAVFLMYMVFTRVLRKPVSAEKFPVTLWVIDMIAWPIFIIAIFAVSTEIMSYTTTANVLVSTTLFRSLAIYLVCAWLLARGVDLLLLRWFVFHRTGFTTPALLRGLTYALFVIGALSLFLLRIGYPITGFLVSTGVVAGILGLALQDTLNDFFSGIALSLDKPFHIGEWVELEDKTVGQVIDLTWRSTRIETFNSTLLSIPNSIMARSVIVNLDRPEGVYAKWYMIRVSAEVDPKLVVTVISTAVGQCKHLLSKPSPSVRLNDASGSPYLYSVWVHFSSYLGHFRGQEQLFMEINRKLKAAGIAPVGELQEIRYSQALANSPINPSIADTLRSMEIFAELDEDEIESIANCSEYILAPADTILLKEYDSSSDVYFVVNGSLESSISVDNGLRALGDQYSAGDSFGWATIVTDEKAIMTVKATSDTLVLMINAESLQPILRHHEALRQRFFDLVTERIKRLSSIRGEARDKRRSLSPADIRRRIERFVTSGRNF